MSRMQAGAQTTWATISRDAAQLYQRAASSLLEAGVPFLVGGAFGLGHFTPLARNTKDFDVFVRRTDVHWALAVLDAEGFATELMFPHWLGKARMGDFYVDVIFSSGNGVAIVDDEWFEHAVPANLMGLPLRACPPEEMIWSKAFVLERERFDGADVSHLLRDCGAGLDWRRLLRRFGRHFRVLLAHVVLYGYIYPSERGRIPRWVMRELLARVRSEEKLAPELADLNLCQGTLLSREQYLVDIEQLGYKDGRLQRDDVGMTADDVAIWTGAIPGRAGEAHGDRDGGRDEQPHDDRGVANPERSDDERDRVAELAAARGDR